MDNCTNLVRLFAVLACQSVGSVLVGSVLAGDGLLVLDDFDGGIQNALGGYRSTFEAPPSKARSHRTPDQSRPDAGNCLRIECNRREKGYCGQWIHFFDMRSVAPKFLDARGYRQLVLWIRGERGGEQLDIRLADRTWIAKEDSVRLGSVTDFSPGGLTRQWQELRIPLEHIRGIDWQELGGITFEGITPGMAVLYVDDIGLRRESSAPAKTPAKRGPPAPATAPSLRRPRAMWLWKSRDVLQQPEEVESLLRFCQRENVRELWMQLLYEWDDTLARSSRPDTPETRCRILYPELWRGLLRRLHTAGIQVHALDGAPEYGLAKNHAFPLGVVDAVIAWNKASQPDERFGGIHFDNEPYLLLGWADPQRREQILREFLDLHVECQRRVAGYRLSAAERLEFGVDIPFWWQEAAAPGGPLPGDVLFRGVRKPASFHCLDWLDNVGIMNYRDAADGADGMIAHGRDLVAYAERAQHAEVYLGVETLRPDSAAVWFALGLPHEKFLAAMRGSARRFADQCRLHELRLHHYDDGRSVHVGVELPATSAPEQATIVNQAMREIAACLGITTDNATADWSDCQAGVLAAISKNAEWRDAAPRNIELSSSKNGSIAPGFVAHSIMLSKITFGDDSLAEFDRQTSLAEAAFAGTRRFRGLAIHCYESFRDQSRTRP